MIRIAPLPTADELDRMAEVTPSDIARARLVGNRDVPLLRPAFDAILIDPNKDPGPIPDQ